MVARPSGIGCALPWQPLFRLLGVLAALMVGGFTLASLFYGKPLCLCTMLACFGSFFFFSFLLQSCVRVLGCALCIILRPPFASAMAMVLFLLLLELS